MDSIEKKLALVIRKYLEDGFSFNKGASELEIRTFISRCESELNITPPEQYIEILRQFDGVVVEGVFLYSTRPIPLDGGDGFSLDFIEMNQLSREVQGMENFVFFGDSDQDCYVLNLHKSSYEVRDKQAFDNVYETFNDFYRLFEYMVDLMVSRV